MEGHTSSYRIGLMSTIQNIFKSKNSHVKKLLGYSQCCEEDKWAEKAIEALVKKLKKKRGALEELMRAVSCPDYAGRCVTIPRSIDGRLQVHHRKGLPHVIYCKILRWPDLRSHHEIRASDCCEYPFSARREEVCINPYHYWRVEQPNLKPILVQDAARYRVDYSFAEQQQQQQYQQLLQQQQQQQQLLQQQQQQMMMRQRMPRNVTLSNYSVGSVSQHFANQAQIPIDHANDPRSMYEGTAYEPFIGSVPQCAAQDQFEFKQPFPVRSDERSSCSHRSMDIDNGYGQNGIGRCASNTLIKEKLYNKGMMLDKKPISYEEPDYWSSIAYYELNSRIGPIFNCSQSVITVDGYGDGLLYGTDRFCLGELNNAQRSVSVENTRRSIGRGLQIHYVGGQVYFEVTSDHAVFVQSRNCNYENNNDLSTVVKMMPGTSLKVFDFVLFREILARSVDYGFESVYELTKMCTIRVSFVKGWGIDYQRHDISSTPCWFEMHLNGPLKWLDNVLTGMGSPQFAISSVS